MPIRYVNPARRRRGRPVKRKAAVRRPVRKAAVSKSRSEAAKKAARKRKRTIAAKKRKRSEAAKKAAATRRRNQARKKTASRKANPAKRKTTMARTKRRRRNQPPPIAAYTRKRKRIAAAKKAAATKAAKARKRSAAAKKAAKTRAANKRKRAAQKAAKTRALRAVRRRRRKRRGGRPSTVKSMRRARRTIKNVRKKPRAKAYQRRFKMRSNPKRRRRRGSIAARRRRGGWGRAARARARARRRYRRRNPSNGMMNIITKTALPIAASLYVSRLISGRISDKVFEMPGLSAVPANLRSPALAAGLFAAGNWATQKGPVAILKRHRNSIMVGLGLNLIDKVVGAFAPENVKSMFGLGQDYDFYGPVGEYVQIGNAPPIDDDITLAEYVQVGQYFDTEDIPGLEEDLGQVYADLGVEEDLGQVYADLGAGPQGADFADRRLGGVTRSSMQDPVGHMKYTAPVPERSFTKQVPSFGPGFDASSKLYTGIFAGGFGY